MQETLNAHIAKVRKNVGEKKTEIDVKRAEKRAENAEDDALFAIDYAYVTIEEAESAVLDAIVARNDVKELATRSKRLSARAVPASGGRAQLDASSQLVASVTPRA